MKKLLVFLILAAAAAGYTGFRHLQRSLVFASTIAQQQVEIEEVELLDQKIRANYPDLSGMALEKFRSHVVQTYMKDFAPQIAHKVGQKVKEIKSIYQNDNGQTYLFGLDSYYWMRLLRNKIQNGHPGDARLNGVFFDRFLNAPLERTIDRNVHINLGYGLYRLVTWFHPGADLESVVFYVPILLTVILI